MSSKTCITPLIRQVTTRGYAAKPVVVPALLKKAEAEFTVLPNKTFVASLDNGSPVSRVTVAFKAGSRYEPATELGISHVLRSAAGLTTKGAASFILARKLAQLGANVSASGDREFIYYTLETTNDNAVAAAELLKDLICNQEFRQWELDDNVPRLKFDLAALSPQARAIDLLHKAAFRRNLGNSLFVSPKRMTKISSESLQHYASQNLGTSRCAIVVVGDNQERAKLIASSLALPSGAEAGEASKYFGGDLRKEMGGDLAHIALALPGARAGTPQSIALAVAAKALGCGPVVKWGADNSPLAKAIGNIGPFAAAGFNVSYSDNGLFGVVLSVPKDEAATAVKAVANALKGGSINDIAIEAGKKQLKLQVLTEAENGSAHGEFLAAEGLYTGGIQSPAKYVKNIEAVSASDVSQAVSQAARGRLSMGAAGNLAFVPYTDELQ